MTLRYLIAYLLYNDAVQTVIVVSALFGAQELGMDSSSLILVVLMVQFMAFFGALLFGVIASKVGAKRAIVISLLIWSGIAIWAQLSLQSVPEFWLLAALVAIVLGGTQALSRSLFSQMIPREREAEFFQLLRDQRQGHLVAWHADLRPGDAVDGQHAHGHLLADRLVRERPGAPADGQCAVGDQRSGQ